MTVTVKRSEGPMSGKELLRRLRWLIFHTWNIPPVFGLGFILLIGVLQPSQVLGILTTPLEPAYILGWLAFSAWFLPRQMRPLAGWLDSKPGCSPEDAQRAVRRFPLFFWSTFLIYLAVAPASVIVAAEIYTGFMPTPYDWFRIELVALIVSIIVGLPIFFLIFNLFGQALGALKLSRPIFTIRTRVFLIGALVPLLIDTMLVQYYWTRTGYFSYETFGVWLLLEALAIGGSMIFAHSFGQSLSPLQELIGAVHPLPEARIAALWARSTDEIGVLTADYRDLLEKQWLQGEIQDINNRLLRSAGSEAGTAAVFHQVVELCCQSVNAAQAFVLVFDQAANELVGVIQSGSDYRPDGHYRLRLDETSIAVWAFNQRQTVVVEDARQDPRVSPRMSEHFNVRSAITAPLQLGESVIGVLMAVTHDGPRIYTARDIALIEGLAREAAYALNAQQLREARARSEKAHLEQQELFGMLLNFTAEGIYGVDQQGICTFVNPAGLRMLGYERPDDMIGKVVHTLIHHTYPDGRPYPMEECAVRLSTREGKPAQADNEVHWRADGSSFPVEFWSHPIFRNGRIEGAVVTFVDITERKAAEARIKFLAYHDALTELPNRMLAKDHFEMAASFADRANAKTAFIFLDLDNFKTVNDTLGHSIGDALLKAAAKRLRECVRDTDTLSRQGGDEFLILLTDVRDPEAVTGAVEKILMRLAAPFDIKGQHLSTSISLGIAVYPDDGKDFDTLLKKADTAMYQAKEAGRNTYRFYTEQMNVDAFENLRMRNGLRQALERTEFVLHYQPQIDLVSGAVIGAEALIRWNHPELGMVPPARFIPVAEESGLIVQIGDWVLLEACRQAVAWREAGLPEMVIAVNVSAVQFKHHNLENSVVQALVDSGLDPACLELELTESILIHDAETVLASVKRLKSLGVKLSIDDFGTGYSSLSYLKRFDVDKLKIDQSFIRDMADDPNDAAIVRAIIQMARSLNLKTIAEGVEDERLLALLRLQHCDEAQGYHFARPMPSDEFVQYIHSTRSAGC